MAGPSFVASGTEFSDTSAAPAFSAPAGVVANQVVVAVFFVDGATDQHPVAPDGTWEAAPDTPVVANNHRLYVYGHRAAGNEAGPYTFTLDGAVFVEGQTHRYTAAVTSGSVFDTDTEAAVDNSDVGTVTPAVSITTSGAERLLLHAATGWSGGIWTPPTGFTKRQQPSVGLSTLADLAQAVAGSSGALTASVTNPDKRTAWLGALRPAAQTITGSAVGTLGALSGAASGVRMVLGVAAGTLGALSGHATGLDTGAGAGGWGSLLAVNQEARLIAAEEAVRRPTACPNDGEPLVTGPRGELFCSFDGWTG